MFHFCIIPPYPGDSGPRSILPNSLPIVLQPPAQYIHPKAAIFSFEHICSKINGYLNYISQYCICYISYLFSFRVSLRNLIVKFGQIPSLTSRHFSHSFLLRGQSFNFRQNLLQTIFRINYPDTTVALIGILASGSLVGLCAYLFG